MELFGLLNTFPVPEVLQWAANDRASGALVFQRSTFEKRLHLAEGNIVACFSSDPLEYFGRYLLAHRRLSKSELLRAIAHCRKSGQRLGQGIVELELMDEASVQAALSQQMSDSICELFLWPRGIFYFSHQELGHEELLPAPLHVLGIAMEGTRWVDEHSRIREVLPHDNIVLGRGPGWPGEELPPLARTVTEEWIGGTPLAMLYRRVGGSSFRFLETVMDLVENGIMDVQSVGRRPEAESEELTVTDLLLEQAESERRRGTPPLSVPLDLLTGYYPQLDGRPAGLLPPKPAAARLRDAIDGATPLGDLLSSDPDERTEQLDWLLRQIRRRRLALLPQPTPGA